MNKLNLLTYPVIAVLSLAAAGAAFADDITPDNTATQVFSSTKTRAQVQAEYVTERNQVAALTAEDSGSAYLTQVAATRQVGTTLAGTPVNGQ